MNKQRKILVTVTYNELGVIVDTKTEELDSSAETELCEYYALCRHGRDENKLRATIEPQQVTGKLNDCISRKAAIDAVLDRMNVGKHGRDAKPEEIQSALNKLPPVQPTLYGYKIEHLAYIARVMEKEGITAEQAAESFDDICMAIRLLIEETTQKVNEFVREMRREE